MSRLADESPAPRRGGAAVRVLVIADDAAGAVERSLRRHAGARFEVRRLPAPARAIPDMRRKAPDAIVLDLAGARAFERVGSIALAHPHVPVVVLAPRGSPGLAARAIRRGAQDFLVRGEADGERLARALRMAIERKRAEEEMRRRAHFDPVTGLANRALFDDRLAHALARARRHRERVALLYADLDGFKAVNDALGHAAGDDVLRRIARRLRGAVRESETAARIGGDEFAVLVESLRDPADARRVAERIAAALRRPLQIEGRDARVTASVGIAIFPDDARDPQSLLRCADRAMFRAKRSGGDRTRLSGERNAGAAARHRQSTARFARSLRRARTAAAPAA